MKHKREVLQILRAGTKIAKERKRSTWGAILLAVLAAASAYLANSPDDPSDAGAVVAEPAE